MKIYILCILAILLHGCPTSTESKIDNEYLTGGFTATFAASASLVETAQVTITWAAVAGATRYELQYGSTAGTYTTTISPVTGGSHLVTGLTNGTLYYFLVVAYKADGSSTNSNVVSARPNTAPNPPTAVLDGSVTTSTAAAPTISWAASTSSSDVDFGGYEIALGTTAGATDTLTWTPVGNVLSYTPSVGITLIDGSVYYATVRAYRSSSIKSTAANGDGFTVNSLTATFRCNFLTSTSTDCYASPYTTTARPVVRYFRAGSASTSPGTYVDSAGVVKIANTNLFPSSEDFTSSWALGGAPAVTRTADQATAPDSTATADLIQSNSVTGAAGTGRISYGLTLAYSTNYVLSAYVKNISSSHSYVEFNPNSGTTAAMNLYWSGATLSSVSAGSFVALPNGWYRISLPFSTTAIENAGTVRIHPSNSAADNLAGIYLWGAQLETGTAASNYTYSSTTANYAPRIDHDPASCTGGACTRLGLLVEEARTNKLTYSEQLDNAAWSLSNVRAFGGGSVANSVGTTAPDGTNNAELIVETDDSAVATTHTIQSAAIAYTVNAQASASVFLKNYGGRRVRFQLRSSPNNDILDMHVDLASRTVISSSSTGGGTGTLRHATIQLYPNDWVRVTLGGIVSNRDTSIRWQLSPMSNTGVYSYAGDGTGGFYAWGAQYEDGHFSSSYIPTTTVALTRTADQAFSTDSSILNAAGNTFFAKARSGNNFFDWISQQTAACFEADTNNRLNLRRVSFNTGVDARANVLHFRAGATNTSPSNADGTWPLNSIRTLGMAFQLNDFYSAFQGTTLGSASSGSLFTPARITLGYCGTTQHLNGHVQEVHYYDSRFANDKLRMLTSP